MSLTVNLPSGLSGVIRGLKVSEANLLANQAEQRRGTALDGVYAAIWEQTNTPGPYDSVAGAIDAKGRLNWSKVLVADRFTLMLDVRIATYGPDYSFKVRCSDKECNERFEWELSLADLPRKMLSSEALEAFKNGNRMSSAFASTGQEFWFRLMDGEGEKNAERLLKQNRAQTLSAALHARIVEITGVHSNDKLKWLSNLDMGDATAVLALLDEHDGGVESNIQVVCPSCGEAQDINLPFDKEFWAPSKGRKAT